jgi:transposase
MTIRGKALTPEVKKLIVSVKLYFDRFKSKKEVSASSVQRTADAASVGVAMVKRIMADYNRDPDLLEQPPSERGRKSYTIDASYQENVRAYVREANQNGAYITLSKIREFLLQNGADDSFHISTLARTLDRWGFEFGKGTRSQHLKEKDHVVAARQRYLRKKRKNQRAGWIVARK